MTARSHSLDRYFDTLGEGLGDWIGVRPRSREPLMAVPRVLADADRGLEGDYRLANTPGSGRQVTLISAKYIDHIAFQLGVQALHPSRLRCNIFINRINLNALRRQRFWVGEALLEASQLSPPARGWRPSWARAA